MMRLSRSLLSGNKLAGNYSLSQKKATLCWSTLSSNGSPAGSDFVSNRNFSGVDADYTIFKGKAALSVSPKLPSYSKNEFGFMRVDKRGAIFLRFWPAIGPHKYDWQKKQVFALSATEVGSVIALGPSDSCDFLHDPSMKSSLEGQVKKTLSITPLSKDEGYFFTLSVTNNIVKSNERLSIPVTKAEFVTIRTALSFALPHIMGWGKAMGPELSMPTMPKMYAPKQVDPRTEWAR